MPIPAGLTHELRQWKLVCPKTDTSQVDATGKPVMVLDLCFPNGDGHVESHANIVNRGFVPAMIAAGVTVASGKKGDEGRPIMAAKYTGLHALRHFFAPWAINPVADGGISWTS